MVNPENRRLEWHTTTARTTIITAMTMGIMMDTIIMITITIMATSTMIITIMTTIMATIITMNGSQNTMSVTGLKTMRVARLNASRS